MLPVILNLFPQLRMQNTLYGRCCFLTWNSTGEIQSSSGPRKTINRNIINTISFSTLKMENCALPADSFVHEVLRQLNFLLSFLWQTNSKSRNLSWLMTLWNNNWEIKTQDRVVYWFVNWQYCRSTIGTNVNNNPPSCVNSDAFRNSGFKAGGNGPNKIKSSKKGLTQAQIRQQL